MRKDMATYLDHSIGSFRDKRGVFHLKQSCDCVWIGLGHQKQKVLYLSMFK